MPKNCFEIDIDVEFKIDGYNMFINKNPQRGVIIYVIDHIEAHEFHFDNGTNESVWCTFRYNECKFLIGNVYRQHRGNKVDFIHKIRDNFTTVYQKNNFDCILITGDFNFPLITWNKPCYNYPETLFVEALRDAYFVQMVDEPTRFRSNQSSNILDLVLCNDDNWVDNIQHLPPIGKSDHELLLISLNVTTRSECVSYERFNYYKGDYARCREVLQSVKWDVMEEMDVNDAWLYFKNKIKEVEANFIPLTPKNRNRRPSWITRSVKRIINKKHKLYKKLKNNRTEKNVVEYKSIRNKTKHLIRESVRLFENKMANECKTNVKGFWKYVNRKLKKRKGVDALKREDGSMAETDEEKADILNTFFSNIYVNEDVTHIPYCEDRTNGQILSDLEISENEVFDKLMNLDITKSMGPDNLHPRLLKEISKEISCPLALLFNKSLSSGVLPEDWKIANVTAIFKKGSKSDVGNYRPISLTCILCKILESLLKENIVNFLDVNDMFNNSQHGFRKKRSCITQLLHVVEDFTKLIDDKKCIDVLYLDFKKAFDTVPHERLFKKIGSYGITGNIFNWIKSFLSGRMQRVVVNSCMSRFEHVLSGVPQGSVLGPLLFILYINDLPDKINCSCKLFADDTKIYASSEQHQLLQEDITSLFEWSSKWQLAFNASKCKVLHIGKLNPHHNYFINGEDNDVIPLTNVDSERDLGVIFDSNLSFDLHINDCIARANRMMGIIFRSFVFMDSIMFLSLYKSLVRSILEYGNVIWSPLHKRQSICIENVQRRATRLLNHINDMSYDERLKYLNLPSLKYRRLRGDLIQMYKLVHKIDDFESLDFFTFSNITFTRGDKFKIYIERCQTTLRQHYFVHRIVKTWNHTSFETKNAETLNGFKIALDREFINLRFDFDGS